MVNRYKMTFNHSLSDLWNTGSAGTITSNTADSIANQYYVNYINDGMEGSVIHVDPDTWSSYTVEWGQPWYRYETINATRDLFEHAESIREYFRKETERQAKEDEDAQIAGKLGDAAELLFGGTQ